MAAAEPSYDDPFGVGSNKKSKPIKKKEKLFFDDTEDESEIDYRPPQKRAPPQQSSIFAEDQAMQARAAQSNRNLFADSVVSANTEDFGDFMPPSKKEPEKPKKKPAKKSGLNLFGGEDETPQAPAPKKP